VEVVVERTWTYRDDDVEPRPTRARTAADAALVLLLMGGVIAISAHAPSTLYAYAQLKRAGTAVAMLETGNWLLPVNQTGEIASKPQLYPWLTAAALKLTGAYHDFVFCLPTVLAALATAVCVYVLARRWHGRRVGLLAGCLWASALNMNKLAYLAATDMLLTLWVTVSLMCADRLLFHRCRRRARWKYLAGLWASMILAALAKGWGPVNLVLVGGTLALAAAPGPGFAALRAVGPLGRWSLAPRLVLRRIRRAVKATRFGWGLLAMAAVLGPLCAAMFLRGGREFRELVYFEFFQRITGMGEHAPKPGGIPAAVSLVYYSMPGSVFALGALLLVPPRRWLTREGPSWLPLCWILAVLLPFSLAHGFRPDYLLPCYGGVAILGAWGAESLRRSAGRGGASVRALRHVFAGVAIAIWLAVAAVAGGYVFRDHLPAALQRLLRMPAAVRPETWWVLRALIVIGLVQAVCGVYWSLKLRLGRLAPLAAIGMLGVMFLHTHVLSRHARTGDGDSMLAFARQARPIVGQDDLIVYRAEKLGAEPYLGRLGVRAGCLEEVKQAPGAWLITCDRGLGELGAYREDPNGEYVMEVPDDRSPGGGVREARLEAMPEVLGELAARSRPIRSQNWGRIYLIRLRRHIVVQSTPIFSLWESGKTDED